MNIAEKHNITCKYNVTGFISKALFYQMEYCIFSLFIKLVSYTPFCILYVISDILFFPIYYLFRYRRKVVRRNLTESFPNKPLSEILNIEKRFYHFFVDMLLESCKLASIPADELKKRMIFTNIDYVNEVLDRGKSVSVFIGHYGNWEWIASMGLWLHKDAIPVQVYHQLHNKPMDKIVRKLRERFGHKSVDMYKTARYIGERVKKKETCIIGFLADQSPKMREAKYFVPFLNHVVPVLTGTEKVAKRFGFEALFLTIKRVKRGFYECTLTPLHKKGLLPDYELTQLYFQRLEKNIIQNPELYLWTHNRFKYAKDK